jgi:hypothetical protein
MRLVSTFNPAATGCNLGRALLIGLTRLFSGVASILRTGVQIDFCPENTDFVPKARPATLRVAMRAGTTGLSPGFL